MTPESIAPQLIADGLWYIVRVARTHEGVAAVLARYHALEAENVLQRAELALDALLAAEDAATIAAYRAAQPQHEIDARELGY
jgi:hypothetical protein